MSINKQKMLIMFDVKNNCNKFYEVSLYEDGEVVARYGRVGVDGVKKSYSGGLNKYNSIINSKKRKGYHEAQTEINFSEPKSVKGNAIDIALKQINYLDKESEKLIKGIAQANIHKIVSSTSIKYDDNDGLFKTPLGVIKENAVHRALGILRNIETYINKGQISQKEEDDVFDLNSQYFVLIPNKVKNARLKENLIFDKSSLDNQLSICYALLETIELMEDLKKGKKEIEKEADEENIPKVFDVTVEKLKDKKMFQKISKMYDESKNKQHGYRVMNSKIENIFEIKLGSQQKIFDEKSKEIGNVHLLWHGTRICNTLSIMSKGLLMPTISPGKKAGAMFGYGLYFANQSSKSIQYCDGLRFASDAKKSDKIYMFLASVAVGKSLIPEYATQKNPPKGYDSYWAKAGVSGVLNDEIIVFSPGQVRLDYLLEISI